MSWQDSLVHWFGQVAAWFGEARDRVSGWIWPFSLLAYPLDWLRYIFAWIAIWINALRNWIDTVIEAVGLILSSFDVWSIFKWWFDAAATAWSWVVNAVGNVRTTIEIWWSGVVFGVEALVNAARAWATDLFNLADAGIQELRGRWDSFWTVTWPTILDLTTVDEMIGGWFRSFETKWAGWIEVRDSVIAFMADPLGYLLDRLEDWFWGPEG